MDGQTELCLQDALADHERQGGLDDDDLYRLVAAHHLGPEQTAALREALQRQGVLDRVGDGGELDQAGFGRDDAVGALLKRSARIRLLTAEEEVQLGRRVALGISAADGEDGAQKERLVRDGMLAREQLILANLRLAFSVARSYQNQGLDLEDVLHEAFFGLIRAAEKFDYTRGYKFSTYATWWLRQAVTRGLADKGRLIRLPVHYVELLRRVVRVQKELGRDLQREATLTELSSALEMEPGAVQAVLDHARQPVSLNISTPDGERDLEHLVPDRAPSTEAIVAEKWLEEDVERRLTQMDGLWGGRAGQILRMRHGLDGGEPRTLDQIGEHFGVTRERIRQIEKKALEKARSIYFADLDFIAERN